MNILLVMVDQLVPFLTGAYGHPVVQTPALDRLAREGIRYDAAYTPYPLCSPARAALLAGRHASDLGTYDNAAVFHADDPTIAHHLTNAGYECVLSGKMHFVGPDQLHGFRRRLTTDVFPAGMDWVPTQDEEGRFARGGHASSYVPPRVGVVPWTQFLSFDEETHFRALEFLRERGRLGAEEPFFLVASYHHPHDPFQVTRELWDLYEGAEIGLPERGEPNYTAMDRWANEAHETDAVDLDDPANMTALRRAYYGLVTYVDRKLGELLDALEQTGRAADTAVIFTSDHGDMLGERRMVQKRCFYEWSVRVPLVVRLPGGERAGTRVERPVSLLDLAPTLLELAEATLPPALDGRSLLGDEDGVVLSEYHVEKVRAPCFMARKGRHKLIHVHGHDARLYDLVADPGEWHDLAGSPELREVEDGLRAAILARFDPERIAADGAASVARRELIARAMQRNGTQWDYQPEFDARRRYVR
ncbi:MAG TPA: choline-sulfatase [Gaiellaceae bacterium]|nr:choline-sulfatase [Gaiellaceae bacterium]